MKGRSLTLSLAIALGINGQIHADALPMRGVTDSRIRTALYSPDEVYRLYGFVGYALDLEFASDEVFVGLSAGDPEAVTYSAHENVLTLRPKAASSQMNLTVSTSKRRYYFEYSIAARSISRMGDEAMYAVRFMYPASPAGEESMTPEQRVARDLALAQKNRPRNVDYWFCGNDAIKPVAASDDGVHTRLTFAAKAELPAIFVSNEDGSESLLNFSMDVGDVVIHRVASRFIVRRGRLTGCIVNQGFTGSGERLDSGTIAPEVTRERKDISP
ncbi:MAG: TrbG/VirB9 family P-type conjugative transfer protein [Steroidobacteraceae bacterium]